MNSLFIALALNAAPALAEEYPAYCEEPKFTIKTTSKKNAAGNMDLLNPEEKLDPEIGRKLASTPGPYGHSELGFRYLARLFGYPGRLGSVTQVENWLADEEIGDYENKKGLKKAWDRWVTEPVKRLSVPLGPVADIPPDANVNIFFRDRWDQANHARCISRQLEVQFCENYLGDRKPESGDRIYYASNSPNRCKLVRNPFGFEAFRKKELSSGKANGPLGGTTTAK